MCLPIGSAGADLAITSGDVLRLYFWASTSSGGSVNRKFKKSSQTSVKIIKTTLTCSESLQQKPKSVANKIHQLSTH